MATCSLPAAATDELPTVAEEWCGAKELVQSGLASFPIDARLLVALELALREGLVGGHWSSLRRSMSEDHDAVLHTPSASGEAELRWGCTKSGVTADNMCYVWAEDEPTLGLFQPLADALIAELAPADAVCRQLHRARAARHERAECDPAQRLGPQPATRRLVHRPHAAVPRACL